MQHHMAAGQRNSFTSLWLYESDSEVSLSTSRKRNSLDHILCELCFTAKHGGYKISWTVWTGERVEIESKRTASTPLHTHTWKRKTKYKGKGTSWSLKRKISGCTVFLSKCDSSRCTNTDVLVCSTLAQLCGILRQIGEGNGPLKCIFVSYNLEHLPWVCLIPISQVIVFVIWLIL